MKSVFSFMRKSPTSPTVPKTNSMKRLRSKIYVVEEEPPKYSGYAEEITSSGIITDSKEPHVRLILSNTDLHKMFHEHARQEYCEESVLLWDNIQKYRTAPTYNTKLQLAHYIYNHFLSPEAPSDVNIKEGTSTYIWSIIETGQMDDDLFDSLEVEVEENLADIYCRFAVTQEYMDYIEEAKRANKHVRTRSSSMPNMNNVKNEPVSMNKRLSLMLSQSELVQGLRKLSLSPRSPKQ